MRNKTRILAVVVLFLLALLVLFVSAEDRDSDLDGVPDPIDKYPFDYDNDGMPDVWEKKYGLRYDVGDSNGDPDDDGIKNLDEYKQSTDPLVSEKTKKRVELELLTPVERAMVKGLIWGGSIFLFLLLAGFILYRTHIFRIFKFLHHVSKEHFDHHGWRGHPEKRKFTGNNVRYYRGRPVLQPQHRVRPYPGMVLRQRPIRKEVPRQAIREFKPNIPPGKERILVGKKINAGEKIEEKPWDQIIPKEEQKDNPKKEGSFERLGSYILEKKPKDGSFERLGDYILEKKPKDGSFERLGDYISEKKPRDIFGRLSDHIHEHKHTIVKDKVS